jgi:hypothetical protein
MAEVLATRAVEATVVGRAPGALAAEWVPGALAAGRVPGAFLLFPDFKLRLKLCYFRLHSDKFSLDFCNRSTVAHVDKQSKYTQFKERRADSWVLCPHSVTV